MVKPKYEERQQARKLRQQGMAIGAIAMQLNVSKGSVSRWVSDIELTPQQKIAIEKTRQDQARGKGAEANRQKWLKRRETYQQSGRDAAQHARPLHMMGCMLYWAEGAKNRHNVNFVNGDAQMMRLFLCFLREELKVTDDEIVLHLHCHHEAQIPQVEDYWPSILGLPMSCLRKTVVKAGSSNRYKRLPFGICSLRVYRTDLVMHIFGAIQAYGGFDNPDWLF
jgi:hypothetical protein